MSNTQNTNHSTKLNLSDDPSASARKTHHLIMAEKAQTAISDQWEMMRDFFDYEPMLNGFPDLSHCEIGQYKIAGKTLKAPLWISSMTGGTGEARHINQNLARAAAQFGLGIGLGSCRQLLQSDEYFEDFNLRPIVGDDVCLMANFGIAQVEQLIQSRNLTKMIEVIKRLEVDGFFIHINPLQEFFQAEGDQWHRSPLAIIDDVLEEIKGSGIHLGVKEVGQGMGPASIKSLFERPISVFEFGAFGGTNFSYLEQMRSGGESSAKFDLSLVGHSALEMVELLNKMNHEGSHAPSIIISGGVRSYLQGYFLMEKLQRESVYGMALPFLTHAAKGYDSLENYITQELKGLKMAQQFLKIKQ